MFRMQRFNCLMLSLLLGFSVIALAAHSAAHLNPGGGACLMCASHAGLEDALPAQEQPAPPGEARSETVEFVRLSLEISDTFHSIQARAPPPTS